MMNVSRQTQAWSKTPQDTPAAPTEKANKLSPGDQEKYFGKDDIGAVLNKAADANWVDPEKKVRAVGNNALDKDAFLKLLLTQMKNQDPTNPLKSHEMAAQLAQFTQLEKLTNIDDSIGGLRKDQQPAQNFEALNLIGKSVSGDSSKLLRTDPKQAHTLRFNLKNDAMKVRVEIKDEESKTIRTLEFNNLKAGKNEVTWNGQLEDGTNARAGEYKLNFDAKDSYGKKVWAETKFEGLIDGLQFTPQGPLLMVGNQKIKMSDVDKIVNASAAATPTQSPPAGLPAGLMGAMMAKGTGAPAPAAKSHLQKDIGMSSGIMNTLKKQGAL